MTTVSVIKIGEQLARIALEIKAISLNPEKPFQWASGYFMPIYNDNRLFLGNAEHRKLVAHAFANIIKERQIACDIIGGTATAGIPHATSLADHLGKPLVYVRKSTKGHGQEKEIEGMDNISGKHVIVIEDLISTGGSALHAVETLRNAGAIVTHVLAIFTYNLGESDKQFKNANCALITLLTYNELLAVAKEKNYINDVQLRSLEEWNNDPFGWGAKHGFPQK